MKTGTYTWRTEFGEEYAIPAAIEELVAAGYLHDQSWHHDAMPSFSRQIGDKVITLWINHVVPELREVTDSKRYYVTIQPCDADGCLDFDHEPVELYDGDDLADALAAIRKGGK